MHSYSMEEAQRKEGPISGALCVQDGFEEEEEGPGMALQLQECHTTLGLDWDF
jgi:hypothetical protein